ncbi:hypothetical protein QCA50_000766 [Cerrena zonata]|uniref:ATP synthase F0 subunit 8 n=1 Tax=Cerrena zonata TaxID=2478898 RepID=A0AAW0GYH5_9APHY
MVFGFFTKKASTPAIPPENVPLPDSPLRTPSPQYTPQPTALTFLFLPRLLSLAL